MPCNSWQVHMMVLTLLMIECNMTLNSIFQLKRLKLSIRIGEGFDHKSHMPLVSFYLTASELYHTPFCYGLIILKFVSEHHFSVSLEFFLRTSLMSKTYSQTNWLYFILHSFDYRNVSWFFVCQNIVFIF